VTAANILADTAITLGENALGITLEEAVIGVDGITSIRVHTTAATPAGTHQLTLTSGTATANFELRVNDAPAPGPTIAVGSQSGTLVQGTAGSVTYAVVTTNIPVGTPITLGANALGVTLTTVAVGAGGTATITINTTAATPVGTHQLTLQSLNVATNFDLVVNPALPRTITVGAQVGTPVQGTAGSATYVVTTANIPANTPITLGANALGVTLAAATVGAGGTATITINTTATTPAGTHQLTLASGGATANFALVVGAPPTPTITVGAQTGLPLIAGTAGSATYAVTTTNIAAGTAITLGAGAPTGVTLTAATVGAGGAATITINTTAATPAGTHQMTLASGGATANVTLVVGDAPIPPPTIEVGEQIGDLYAGTAGSVTYAVTTTNIAAGAAITLGAGAPAGVTLTAATVGADGTATITLNTTAATPAGTHQLTLASGTATANFTLLVREVEGPNRTYLEAAVEEARELDPEDFDAEGWAELEAALEHAEAVLANDDATQDEIDEALERLEDAKDALIPIAPPVLTHYAYMQGDAGTNNFAPERAMNRAEAAAVLVRLFVEDHENMEADNPFDDVVEGQWYYHYVAIAYAEGLVQGTGGGLFAPDGNVTREQFAAMVVRAQGVLIEDGSDLEFADADQVSDWAVNYVYTVVHYGWMQGGTDNTFAPAEYLQRAQAVAVINRIDGRAGVDSASLVDVMEYIELFDDVQGPVGAQWFFYYVIAATHNHRVVVEDDVVRWVEVFAGA